MVFLSRAWILALAAGAAVLMQPGYARSTDCADFDPERLRLAPVSLLVDGEPVQDWPATAAAYDVQLGVGPGSSGPYYLETAPATGAFGDRYYEAFDANGTASAR